MNKIIIANWKMNPKTVNEAVTLARASDAKNVVVCPPFPFIPAVSAVLRRAAVGGQDAAAGITGPKTGEVSVGELKALGARYVILGHSERRAEGEREAQIAEKVSGAFAAGSTPILCVGEPWSVRKKGIAAAKAYVKKQLTADLSEIKNLKFNIKNLLIAYEPVWAISTSKNRHNETPEDAANMALFIKKSLSKSHTFRIAVLYGGSVNSKNATAFLERKEFSGILVGGASTKPTEFRKIIAAAREQ